MKKRNVARLAIIMAATMVFGSLPVWASSDIKEAADLSNLKYKVEYDDSEWTEENPTVEAGEVTECFEGPATGAPQALLYENIIPVDEDAIGDPDKTYTIGYSSPHSTNVWYAGQIDTILIETDRHSNLECTVLSADGDATQQANDIDALVTQGVDVIIVDPIQPDALVSACKSALAAGVPVVVVDRPMDDPSGYASMVTASAVNPPTLVANAVVDHLKEKYGEVKGKIVEIQTDMGSTPQITRHDTFTSILGEYDGVEIVGGASAGGDENKAYDLMSDYISAYPEFDVLFAHSEAMALGARKAMEAANFNCDDIFFCAVDLSKEGVKWLMDGKLNALGCYTPCMGDIAVRVAINIIEEKPIPKQVWLPEQPLATPENCLDADVCGGAFGLVPDEISYVWQVGQIPGSAEE